jgi:hypothetical protein
MQVTNTMKKLTFSLLRRPNRFLKPVRSWKYIVQITKTQGKN